MNETIALFPLQIVVFPEERLNLHIFEPRYKQLIKDCITDGITFGVNTFMNSELQPIGTEIKLLAIEKEYENGELDIRTRGMGLYRLEDYFPKLPGKLYAGGQIIRMACEDERPLEMAEELLELTADLYAMYELTRTLPEADTRFLSFRLAHYLGLQLDQEYELLCLATESERLRYLINHIQGLMPSAQRMKSLKDKVRLNGHFKNLTPPNF